MIPQPLRIGLVGAGSIAQVAELPALAATPGVTIAGVVTRTPESARSNIERWPIERAYDSIPQMIDLAHLDALMVLTPKQVHAQHVELGLRAGLDVFCEKPLTTSLDDARRVANLADETQRILMVAFNRRYAEVYATAHARTAGNVQFCVAQKNRRGSEYRATIEHAIHMVDLLRWFCGEPESVTAQSVAPDPYQEDGTAALVRFRSGAVGVLMAARLAGEWDERLDVYGGNTSVRVTAPDAVAIAADGETRVVQMRPRANGWAQVNTTLGFGPEVTHFVECVRERKQARTSAHDAVRTHALMDEILRPAGLPLDDRPEVGA